MPTRDHGAALFLSQMPPQILTQAKARAHAEGRTMKWVIIQLLTAYIQHGLPAEPKWVP